MSAAEISEAVLQITERVFAAEKRAGRKVGSTTLIAVSKTKPVEAIIAAHSAGLRNFGENYVQEALKKIEDIQNHDLKEKINWHFIGALQTNKAKSIVGKFDLVHSVGRLELATTLSKRAIALGVVQPILIQVNLGEESSKSGVAPKKVDSLLTEVSKLKGLRVEGLMGLPPLGRTAEDSRQYFKQLRVLRESLAPLVPRERGSFTQLSMGTTHDFEIAIEEGATLVRIGTAIFGSRN